MRFYSSLNASRKGRRALLTGTVVAGAMAVGAAGAVSPADAAEDWPSEPIELIVGFGAGGGTDLVGRAIADALEKELDVPVQVVNRTGGGGVVGFDALRTADPDGNTIGIVTAQVITANLRGVMDATWEDFTHIGMINIDQAVIAVPGNSDWESFDDFIAAAGENPGEVTVGNGGEGGSYHMMARNLEMAAEVEFNHVPFDGGPAAILQLVGGHIDAAAVGAVEIAPQAEAGEARVLAVAGQEDDPRFPRFPDVPTTAELGVPLEIGTWRALGMPGGVDPDIVEKLSGAMAAAVEDEEFVETMEEMDASIRYFGPEDLEDYIRRQERAYQDIID